MGKVRVEQRFETTRLSVRVLKGFSGVAIGLIRKFSTELYGVDLTHTKPPATTVFGSGIYQVIYMSERSLELELNDSGILFVGVYSGLYPDKGRLVRC